MTHRVTTPLKDGTITLIAEVLLVQPARRGFIFLFLPTRYTGMNEVRDFLSCRLEVGTYMQLSLFVNSPNINCTLVDVKLVSMGIFVQFLSSEGIKN